MEIKCEICGELKEIAKPDCHCSGCCGCFKGEKCTLTTCDECWKNKDDDEYKEDYIYSLRSTIKELENDILYWKKTIASILFCIKKNKQNICVEKWKFLGFEEVKIEEILAILANREQDIKKEYEIRLKYNLSHEQLTDDFDGNKKYYNKEVKEWVNPETFVIKKIHYSEYEKKVNKKNTKIDELRKKINDEIFINKFKK